jgi:hypothetical protein
MGTTGRPRGRPKGAKNKRTAEREAATKEIAAQIEKSVGGAFEGDALAYLMSVYKDPLKPENLRIDAAKAAIRYERPALAPVAQAPESDFVPLAERLAYYERRDAIEEGESKVAELKKPGQR